nr:hypothetical protein [uncultured Brevundimonas sp.]
MLNQKPFDFFSSRMADYYPVIELGTRIVEDCVGSTNDVADVVNYMIAEYEIRDPEIVDWNRYFSDLIKSRGVRLSDFFRYFSRIPELDFSEITVGELCSAAESHFWPNGTEEKLLSVSRAEGKIKG